jgi:hypothetical protein
MRQLTTVLLFIKLLPKNTQNLDQKDNQRQHTVCLEQQIIASPKNFTPTLLVMLETFRRSAYEVALWIADLPPLKLHQSTKSTPVTFELMMGF